MVPEFLSVSFQPSTSKAGYSGRLGFLPQDSRTASVAMCSVQEDDVPLRKAPVEKCEGRLCMKCKEQKAILITRVNDAFCRACFQVYVTHKFRACIGKTKLVRDGELVLVGFSGGPCSAALLNLIEEGLSQRAHKKLRFRPGVLFIDEGVSVGLSAEERLANCEKVHAVIKKAGFPCHMKGLEEGLDLEKLTSPSNEVKVGDSALPSSHVTGHVTSPVDCDTDSVYSSGTASVTLPDMSECGSPAFRDLESSLPTSAQTGRAQCTSVLNDPAEDQLKQILANIKSTSAKEDFIRCLRLKILYEVAKQHGYSKVMLASCGTQLAVRLLTDISTGRGAHAAMETAFGDGRHEDIMFLRPLRDFSSKEVAIYNSLHQVETLLIPTLTTKGEPGASIEHLTENFVTGLQAEYPSTVSNIMRTGEKLDSKVVIKEDTTCAMCQGPLDTSVGAASAMSAVEFSQKISSRGQDKGDNPGSTTQCKNKGDNPDSTAQCCGEGDGSCQTTSKTRARPEEVLSSLCYGCRLVAKELDDVYRLPEFVIKDSFWRVRRRKMQEDIKDFLLDQS